MNNHKKSESNGNRQPQSWNFDYVTCPIEQLLKDLGSSNQGLTEAEVHKRLEEYGYNEPVQKHTSSIVKEIALRFINPLVIVLFVIAAFSLFFGEVIDAILVTVMASLSIILGFVQEYRANKASEDLREMVHTTATVWRRGKQREVPLNELVPGDIVDLFAGDMIPADVRILHCKDFFVNQSTLTGESFPIEKSAAPPEKKTIAKSSLPNFAFMGSSVVSGTALAVVVHTGVSTEFGELYQKISTINPITSFDRGVRQFTLLMVKAMLCMVAFIFAIVALRHGNYLNAFLFSLGVAVGLTPEMLPMIVTITLSKGAIALSKKNVIVKSLNSIQNFGAMDVLCTDKTGTLTVNKILLEKHCDVSGKEDEDVLRYAYINSFYQTGLKNVLDKAILNHEKLYVTEYEKIDEIPFDFSRRIMSVAVRWALTHRLIAKGAPEEVFKRCTHYYLNGVVSPIDPAILTDLMKEYQELSSEGFRVLAIAYSDHDIEKKLYTKDDEKDLILKGYVAFYDPPKTTAKRAIIALKKLNIKCKVLTGDNELVTKKICTDVDLDGQEIVSGETIELATDEELSKIVENTNIFTRLLPAQKDRIIRALQKNGHIVGYLGDGINDASALKASDVGISVNNAADIAKESADLILLKKSLLVLRDGVLEGRKTFGNIIKYIKMSSSSNFGNMLSMTGASLFLPFLPMLPIQILLNNLLYDFSQIAIPTDGVDREYLVQPKPWNVEYIKKFMVIIGPVSSIFDFITFGVLLFLFHSSEQLFHTGWFIESLCTQTLVIYIIRTSKIPFVESVPSRFLLITSLFIVLIGILIPISPLSQYFGFVSPPSLYYFVLAMIIICYLGLVQIIKNRFIQRFGTA